MADAIENAALVGESMADAIENAALVALGMAIGGFLFTLGNYLAFRFFKRLNDPLLKIVNEIIQAIDNAIKGSKK